MPRKVLTPVALPPLAKPETLPLLVSTVQNTGPVPPPPGSTGSAEPNDASAPRFVAKFVPPQEEAAPTHTPPQPRVYRPRRLSSEGFFRRLERAAP